MANYCLPNDLPLQLAQLLHVEGESNSANLSQLVEGQCSVACTSSSSGLLALKGVGQGPGSSLGPVTKAERLSNGWAGQAHARQPWGEWLPGTLAVKMAVRRARWTAR